MQVGSFLLQNALTVVSLRTTVPSAGLITGADLRALPQRGIPALLVLAAEEEPLRERAGRVGGFGEEAAVLGAQRENRVLRRRRVSADFGIDAEIREGSGLERLLDAGR